VPSLASARGHQKGHALAPDQAIDGGEGNLVTAAFLSATAQLRGNTM